MPDALRRTLAYQDGKGDRRIIGEDEIAAFSGPVVILGDPGMGKTILTKMLGAQPNMVYCPAGTFVREADSRQLIGEGERIVVDGLDEIASAQPGGGVDAVLRQLSVMGRPPFVLSCREADWRGASDRVQMKQDYGEEPVLLHLQPFSFEDAHVFLSNRFPTIDPSVVLSHLRDRGLDGLYRNPLTLRLLGEVAQEEAPLPGSRAELLERACRAMLREENPVHHDAPHAQVRPEDLLLAAGAICAAQLLCDRIGVFTGPPAHIPEGFVSVGEVAALPFGEAADAALQTRLFRAVGERRFTHIHRVIAEYLGAAWLAQCVGERCSERRLFSLFRPGDGVPTSLRGLHAWIGHFDGCLAHRSIATDPYAVLRYGDAETIGVEQARALLAALKELAQADPYFASEDWGWHRAAGLMRPELRGDIQAIVTAPGRNLHLSVLVLKAMVGTELARELAPMLDSIMFDPERVVEERLCAADALRASGSIDETDAVICRLLTLGDANSAHVACEFLSAVGARTVSIATGVETVLANLRITVSDIPRSDGIVSRDVRDDLFRDLNTLLLASLLDELASRAEPLYGSAGFPARSELADLLRRLVAQVLEAGAAVAPKRLWAWLRWVDGHDDYSSYARQRLTEILRSDLPLRATFLEHVVLTPCGESPLMAAHALSDLGLDLCPTEEDLAVLLSAARVRAGDESIDEETWHSLLLLRRTREGLTEVVQQAAREAANGDPALLDVLGEMSEPVEDVWQDRRDRREALEEERRQEVFGRHRNALSDRLPDVDAGDFRALTVSAEAYLGRWSARALDRTAPPEIRLNEFLGEAFAARVRVGFIAALHRSDLPSASDIAAFHAKGKLYGVELLMMCGVAELLRQGRALDGIDQETLAGVYMAWCWARDSDLEGGIDIGPALEELLLADECGAENHFRTSIEPQLAAGCDPVVELYRLTHDPRWAPLAGRLAVDWLRTYRELPSSVQTALVQCAVDSAANDLARRVGIAERIEGPFDHEAMLLWMSASFVVEFQLRGDALRAVAVDEPHIVWRIRDRLGEQHREDFSRLSVGQLAFIVESFGQHWPVVSPPAGVMRGNCNPWDASVFIKGAVSALAARPCPEATEALQYLIDSPAVSYADTLRHAVASQRRARRDFEYDPPSLEELQGVMEDGLPESIDGMRACLLDRLDTIQRRMHASNTDTWRVYWRHDGVPQDENYCRDRLVEPLSDLMPRGVQLEPEAQMPGVRRVDFVASYDEIRLPVEIKGQWHRKVWTAASEQLDAYYTRELRAKERGVYIVFWFGACKREVAYCASGRVGAT